MNLEIRYSIHSIKYLFGRLLFNKKLPFIAGMVLNNDCNLKCLHCNLQESERTSLSFKDIENGLDELHRLGICSLAITGGEPFLWSDGDKNVNDVIKMAIKKKFLVVSVYTNGTFPINSLADNVFVSIDGSEETTNKLRGPIFSKVIENIKNSKHPKIFINFTINRLNAHEIEKFCQYIASIQQIKGVFFYFHTPYYGIDDLFQTRDERIEIAQRLLLLKKKYRILNSKSALIDFITDNWPRPSKVCMVFSDRGEIVECCRAIKNRNACDNCGYLGYLEVLNITRFKYSAIQEAVSYLPSRAARSSYVN